MVAGSARLSGYAVSDGASRFHDDARLSSHCLVVPLLSRRLLLLLFTAPSSRARPPRAGTKNTDGCSAILRETRWPTRERAGEKRYFEIIGDCRLSGIVPIVSIPDIECIFSLVSQKSHLHERLCPLSLYRKKVF